MTSVQVCCVNVMKDCIITWCNIVMNFFSNCDHICLLLEWHIIYMVSLPVIGVSLISLSYSNIDIDYKTHIK